jgi:hypothetical protein
MLEGLRGMRICLLNQTHDIERSCMRKCLGGWFWSIVDREGRLYLSLEPLFNFPLDPAEQPAEVAGGPDEIILEPHFSLAPVAGLSLSVAS